MVMRIFEKGKKRDDVVIIGNKGIEVYVYTVIQKIRLYNEVIVTTTLDKEIVLEKIVNILKDFGVYENERGKTKSTKNKTMIYVRLVK
jgi:hypothetical protein